MTSMKRKPEVLHGTKDFVLRPDYEAMVAEYGEPPLGVPDECKFHWPAEPLKVVAPHSSSGRYIYVGSNAQVDASHTSDVTVIVVPDHDGPTQ